MKKVMLIGKFNEITNQINSSLSPYCRVQRCADDMRIVEDMLKLFVPDLVIVSLVGARTAPKDIISLLSEKIPDVRLTVIGAWSDEGELTDAGLLPDERIRFFCRPVDQAEIVAYAKEILRSGGDDDDDGGDGGNSEDAGGSSPGGLKKILVVDDSPAMLRTVQSILSKKYKVTFATSGLQAISAIAKSKPDLILLDYDMPVCDGKMTLQMLRSEESTKDIPVVFLTGCSDAEHVKKVLALLPQGYLLKPPSVSRLLATIEQVLAEEKEPK